MKAETKGTVQEITGGGGKKRRKLEDEDVQLVSSSSSSSYLQLRSRTVVIRPLEGEKMMRKSDYSVETGNCGEGVERNRVLSRCSSNSSGDFETTEEQYWSRSGDHNQESKEKEEDSDFKSASCSFHQHCDSEGGGGEEDKRRKREWTPSSDQEENCSREEEEELDNLEATGRGIKGLSGHSIRPKTARRNTRMLKLSSKMPSEADIEEFFTSAEDGQNKKFMEKYNYDLVNDVPVEGRYEWIKLNL